MSPITADNAAGRSLLALRAGPMTAGELCDRLGCSLPSWLVKAGYVAQDADYYRITDAGRVACPFRNPLAAPKAQPAIQESIMAREKTVSRQDVLAAIVAAGPEGTTPKRLIEQFNCEDQAIYNHVLLLSKQMPPVIFKPEKGRLVGIQFNNQEAAFKPAPAKLAHASREAILTWLNGKDACSPMRIAASIGCTDDSTQAVLSGLFAGLQVDREKVGDEFFYFLPRPKVEAAPSVCGQEKAVCETQAALTHTDETQAPVDSLAKHLMPPVILAYLDDKFCACGAKTIAQDLGFTIESTIDVLHSLYDDRKINRVAGEPGNPMVISIKLRPFVPELELFAPRLPELPPADETIEIKAPADRRGPIVMAHPDETVIGVFTNGQIEIADEFNTVVLTKAVVAQLRDFVGRFAEVSA
ncbi:MAG: winged helix-turn-helix transcriptional regulator [Dechloromonas sp.]|nr:winged helix-turn-helix transcriptional regulator [Dechloromonas sp.]